MSEVIGYAIGLGPWFILALGAALAIGLASPWAWRRTEAWTAWVILTLTLLPVAGGEGQDGSLFRQVTWGGLLLVALARLIGDRPLPLRSYGVSWALAALLAWVLISVAWSPEPEISLRRAVQTTGVLLLALVLVRRTGLEWDLGDRLYIPLMAFLVIGLLYAAALPTNAMDSDGALRAISSHKNTWGQFSLLCAIVFLSRLIGARRQGSMLALLFFVAAVASLAMSRSATSIMAFAIVSAMMLFWRATTSKSAVPMLGLLATAFIVATVLHIHTIWTGHSPIQTVVDLTYQLAGRSQTLTGRTYLWQLMAPIIERHLWWGTGHGGFWTGPTGLSNEVITRLTWGPPTQAHSGYIDAINELGLIGVTLFAATVLIHVKNLLTLFRNVSQHQAVLHTSILIAALFINYAETSMLRTTHFWWIVLLTSLVNVGASVRAVQRDATPHLRLRSDALKVAR